MRLKDNINVKYYENKYLKMQKKKKRKGKFMKKQIWKQKCRK